jgi:outer membrane protein assembly factor BamE (lipoprotein component of BamABCDE complex)
MKKFILCLLVSTAFAASGCTPTEAIRGNLLQNYQLSQVKPGVDTQSDVLKKLGSPTTKAPFDDNTWYYMGQRTEKRGILDPKIIQERIVIVRFDPTSGVVQEVKSDVDPHRLDIPYERDKTPTSGSEVTIMQQMLGNMGKFNKAGAANGELHGSGEGTSIPGR